MYVRIYVLLVSDKWQVVKEKVMPLAEKENVCMYCVDISFRLCSRDVLTYMHNMYHIPSYVFFVNFTIIIPSFRINRTTEWFYVPNIKYIQNIRSYMYVHIIVI